MITVFTPTYNRLELLKRLHQSLLDQTDKSFEWVVVDDASTDGTDAWMRSVSSGASFPIIYRKNPHGGKHRAINTGVELAKGEYFFIVDSDDYLPENSIETLQRWIKDAFGTAEGESGSSESAESGGSHTGGKRTTARGNLAGITGMRVDTRGQVIGEHPDIDAGAYVECGNLQRYRSRLMGDKAEVFRLDVLKQYPFPEYEGEDFLTERIVWDRIAHDGYVLRWYNAPVYTCEYQEEGLSKGGANSLKGHLKNYRGYLLYVRQSVRFMESAEAVTVFREYDRTARIRADKLRRSGKAKGGGLARRAKDIDFSVPHYLCYLLIKMPAVYAVRILKRIIHI